MFIRVKSKKVLNIIFGNIKTRKKYTIIKYNKKLQNRLDLHFEIYQYLQELNEKYNLNIKDINIKIFKLLGKNAGNSLVEYLNKICFEDLQEIDIKLNHISDIKQLGNMVLRNLEKLDLSHNFISDINIFAKINFDNLKELYLGNNNKLDIKSLEKVKLEKLEILDLSRNGISDIIIFEKVKLPKLKILYLQYNFIKDVKALESFKLELLDLRFNYEINDTKCLTNIKELKVSKNT